MHNKRDCSTLQRVPRAEQKATTLYDQANAFRELSMSLAVDDA